MVDQIRMQKGNNFSFTCPIFNAETKIESCAKLRDLVWQGRATPGLRKGCQVAMQCSKCPVSAIIAKTIYVTKAEPQAYISAAPVHGKLMQDVLEKIMPVMIQPRFMEIYGVTPAERALLETANERIEKQLLTAPKDKTEQATYNRPSKRTASPAPAKQTPPTPKNDAAALAARTGDMSAALNAA